MPDTLPPVPPGGHAAGPPRFQIELWLSRTESILTLRGELDLATRELLTGMLAGLDAAPDTVVRVDLGQVSFIDSTGLEPLVEAARRRQAAGRPPLLWAPRSDRVDRLLELLGMHRTRVVDLAGWDAAGWDARRPPADDGTGEGPKLWTSPDW